MQPEISVIIPCYNKEKYVEETLNSILAQSFENYEIIIVDDCSSDSSVKTIETYAKKDPRIKLVLLEKNKGANYCRNRGIELALGEYLLFMDADDLLDNNCLENRIKKIRSKPIDFLVFTMQVFNSKPGDDKRFWTPNSKNPLQDFLSHDLPWQTMQPLWKREFVLKTKGFDETFERMQDVEFHTRVLMLHPNFEMIINEPDSFFRIDEERKNYNTQVFLNKWVNASIQYCEKFNERTKSLGLDKFLLGTIYQTYLQIIHECKSGKIEKIEFKALEEKLLNSNIMHHLSWLKKFLFKFARFYNLHSPRIPGINKTIKGILTS